MTALPLTVTFRDESETRAFAIRLGAALRKGDVLLLHGQVGAGKTAFARALIQSRLPVPEDVPSPTFTLVQTYDGDGLEIWHADLYRLTHPDDVLELGLEDAFSTAMCLVEWPDRLGGLGPPGALHLHFSVTDTPGLRHLRLSSDDARWAAVVTAAKEGFPHD
ncbi:tRNA threonylcarbamoyladenosine biosynthesis protein TsaE [Rhodovulum imhoffii]|uniref:tRNA threonylcarbamoyladenosine biosynthesis protein TsaE n=1 Tax=Rhodovulum imhoffii TaxID=365340 RepID=A0A2T5BRN9_9RHOB|nr:tRNA (adenosine(37)-N6)-threonylcarbamoyltransferase complex ATPase subunit type 1 TsaE [Rhodovulum imhoffii]MBK5934052.1 tRNA (adenosine(37)-N6)-threonylcarbamoyltransferase complex ATPase subunit type 1 TsaE [Rhodovulum imhoffii]PTN01937.1 tRNA threonylcarbamoyladenosine biosynthesis protein TsaE [Rhodovulum imhoffii]